MPDTLNKQTLINLLIDSPLREPIKINLIDIVNNTSDPDLPKVFPTIIKELEIFQKATERRMKLADETIAKLGGTTPSDSPVPTTPTATTTPTTTTNTPPLDLPPLPTEPALPPAPLSQATNLPPLSVPPLDLPPLPSVAPSEGVTLPPVPQPPVEPPVPPMPTFPTPPTESAKPTATTNLPPLESLGSAPQTGTSDEDALAEIQKELDSLKAGITTDANPTPTLPPTPQP